MLFNNKSVRFEVSKDSGGSSDGTPAVGSVPAGTLTPGAADAGQEAQRKLEEALAKREQDINNLKSSLQRQMSQREQEWQQQRAQLESELNKARMASLDDDEKKEFQRNLEAEQSSQWRTIAQQKEQELQQLQAAQNYKDFFVAQGVPADNLVTDQGLDALVASGWHGIQKAMSELKAKVKEYETTHMTSVPTPQNNQADSSQRTPLAASPAPAGNGPNWNDLIKQYGSAEEVYKLVEAGDLSPSIIPTA